MIITQRLTAKTLAGAAKTRARLKNGLIERSVTAVCVVMERQLVGPRTKSWAAVFHEPVMMSPLTPGIGKIFERFPRATW